MTPRTIAIGDIHGCADALVALLDTIGPHQNDTLVTLGDYVDRGSQSRDVVECLLDVQDRCELVPLRGNHEQLLLAAREDARELDLWKQCGGRETLESYGVDVRSIPQSHIDFFESCSVAYETDSHIFVHANYEPTASLEDQDSYVLLWKHLGHDLPGPHVSGKTVVVGHTPQRSGEVLDAGHLICIDTFCFGNGWLTAMDVNTKTIWQANKHGKLRHR